MLKLELKSGPYSHIVAFSVPGSLSMQSIESGGDYGEVTYILPVPARSSAYYNDFSDATFLHLVSGLKGFLQCVLWSVKITLYCVVCSVQC